MAKINKKESYIVNFKDMDLEDKILLVMEYFCYILAISTMAFLVLAISRGYILSSIILLLGSFGFVAFGLSARSTRDSFIDGWKLKFNNKKITQFIKIN